MKCPECHGALQEGFVPTGGGMLWFRRRQPDNSIDFAEHLPGTFAWFRRARLEAYRCPRCQLVLIRYGKQIEHPETFRHGERGG